MATVRPEVVALTEAYRVAQNRRAALIAALVVQWWRTRVRIDDQASVERWLELMVPRIIAEFNRSGRLAEEFYTRLRKLEAPGVGEFEFIRPDPLEPDRVRASLNVTGPVAARKKLAAYDKMSDRALQGELGAESRQIDRKMIERAVMEDAAKQILGSSFRHAANGGREGLVRSSLEDKTALGWVRVTRADPCYFCAMLASRGLEYGSYDKDSFDRSDPRFVGSGDAKVHDHCGCSIKPVYSEDDDFLARSRDFEDMWYEWSTGSSAEAILTFRRGYEGRIKAA